MISVTNPQQLSDAKQPVSISKRDEKITVKKVSSPDVAKAAARCN